MLISAIYKECHPSPQDKQAQKPRQKCLVPYEFEQIAHQECHRSYDPPGKEILQYGADNNNGNNG